MSRWSQLAVSCQYLQFHTLWTGCFELNLLPCSPNWYQVLWLVFLADWVGKSDLIVVYSKVFFYWKKSSSSCSFFPWILCVLPSLGYFIIWQRQYHLQPVSITRSHHISPDIMLYAHKKCLHVGTRLPLSKFIASKPNAALFKLCHLISKRNGHLLIVYLSSLYRTTAHNL